MLAAGLQDWVDFGVICALLLLNAAVGFIQEFQAGSIVDELKKTLALQAICLRNGKLGELAAPELVPGDIIQVEEVCFKFLVVDSMSSLTILYTGKHNTCGWPHCHR